MDAGDRCLPVDSVILCAASVRTQPRGTLKAAGKRVHLIGGADLAVELDAQRAIRQGRNWRPRSEFPTALGTCGYISSERPR